MLLIDDDGLGSLFMREPDPAIQKAPGDRMTIMPVPMPPAFAPALTRAPDGWMTTMPVPVSVPEEVAPPVSVPGRGQLMVDIPPEFQMAPGSGGGGKSILKKLSRVLAPPVFVPKEILEKAPGLVNLPGVRAAPTSVKEVEAMHKEDVKALRSVYVGLVMKPLSNIDPAMARHYQHEKDDNEIKRLRVQIEATTDPVQRQELEAKLQRLVKREEQYQKQGAIVRAVVSIVATFVPILAPIAIYIQLANAAYAAAKAKNNIVATKEAIKNMKRQEAEAIEQMVRGGLSHAQAQYVLGQLKAGVSVEEALQSVLMPANAVPNDSAGVPAPDLNQEYKPVKLATPQAAQQAFLDWLKSYNTEAYEAVLREMPRVGGAPLSGYRDYSDLAGLGFWDTLATAANAIVSTAGTVMKSIYDKKLMDVQIKQMRAQQAPLPTPVAQQVATGQRPEPAAVPAVPAWVWPAGGAALLLGGVLLYRGRWGR